MKAKTNPQGFEAALQSMLPMFKMMYEQGAQDGFMQGFAAGEMIGYVRAINDMKPALSDGLRHGSPECGRVMQGLRNLNGKDFD